MTRFVGMYQTAEVKVSRRAILGRLLVEAKPYYPRLAFSLVLGVIGGLGSLIYAWASGVVTRSAFGHGEEGMHVLYRVVAIVFAVVAVSSAAAYGQSYITAWSGQRMIAAIRVRLFSRILHLPLREFDKWRPGEILTRFTNDLQLMTDAVSIALPQLIQTVVTFVGALVGMIYTDWLLTLFLIVSAPAVNFAVATFTRLISSGTRSAQERIADLSSNLSEVVQGERIVKAFGREEYETERFSRNNENYFGTYMKLTQFGQTQTPVVGMIMTVALIAIMVFSGREVLVGRMRADQVVSFWALVVVAINPMNRFAAFIGDLSKGLIGASRVFEVLDLPVEVDSGTATLGRIEGAIRFENVTFGYELGAPSILHGFTADVDAGEIVALVGPSGAGKTTIVNLVPRFYEPQSGRITLDGVDIASIRLADLRAAIAIVPQESLLFSGTIAENIRYGRLGASDADVELAAREANAAEFIHELPAGYETLLGERGLRLSGGQRQRIAIARAVLRDPRILILDEATSALDSHSERLIEAALDTLLRGRTTLIIAHRLSTIRRAHRILYIDSGRVLEMGTHDDLMKRRGPYARLHAAQFAG